MSNGGSNGRNFFQLNPAATPAKLIQQQIRDAARLWPNAAPLFGDDFLPQVFTITGREGIVARAYSNPDEAIQHNRRNARIMRNEPAIMECLEARMRCTALLNWNVKAIDLDALSVEDRELLEEQRKSRLPKRNRIGADELASRIRSALRLTPRFTAMRYSIMDAIWYGRYAIYARYDKRRIGNQWRTIIKQWEPRNGDKLMFRYNDKSYRYDENQVGILVGLHSNLPRTFTDFTGRIQNKIEPTQHGLCYWLDPNQRRCLYIHKHIIEDGDFDTPNKAGSIHGIGIRNRIYWTWWAYQECLKLLLEYVERSALGIEVWRYPAHNPKALDRAKEAARNRGSSGRSAIFVPVATGEQAHMYGVEIVEPGLGGIHELDNLLRAFFGHKIKRYILGQVLSSEAEATGLGSGVAEAHMATFKDIIRFDATNLEDSLSDDLVRVLQEYDYPDTLDEVVLRFTIDTESPQARERMEALQFGWNMGLKIKEDDLYEVMGASKPTHEDEYVENPIFLQNHLMAEQQRMQTLNMAQQIQQQQATTRDRSTNKADSESGDEGSLPPGIHPLTE